MKRSKFFQFFPPPLFLQMQSVGLDISDAAMRFVELVPTHKGLVVGRFGEQMIPRGVIESGEIKKPEELRAIFTEMKKKHNLEFVSASLPEEKTYSFSLVLPVMKYDNVRSSIELALEDNVPLKPEEALFDYEIVHESDTGMVVNVSVVPIELVSGYLEAFSGTGITPVSFEVETDAVARAVIPASNMLAHLVVDFGRTRSGVTIVSQGVVRFTSTVAIGGGLITEAIAKTLNITHNEAEKVKHEKGIFGGGSDELNLVIMSKIVVLKDEIYRHLAYWNTHENELGEKHAKVEKVILCGGDSNLTGFREYLSGELGLPVEIANVMVNVNTLDVYVPDISFNDSLRYATAVGLALRSSK